MNNNMGRLTLIALLLVGLPLTGLTNNDVIASANGTDRVTTKKIGIMVALKQKYGYMNNQFIHFWSYYNKTKFTKKLRGDHWLTVNGDGTADTYFKVHGNLVTYHSLEPTKNGGVAGAKVLTHHTTVSNLKKHYYGNHKQRSKVNRYDRIIKNSTW
ncbi:hypothetical protein MOO44_00650 (plasmid) [Nicoliella spurrieriana]|uniref:Lreu-0056-like domain-containing protein n=1 Tax=Nicoliella spurrieriana TaxID=2925830 RepID=A0A976RQY3_9LACO|nr:hypothetical protein [Nicoliella spurrieriana]UQS86182.1 hypothetical protein MOO44_00650 [Nicoliella spurrieriana]